MVQKTVLKVRLTCEKDRKKILKSVAGLHGVDKIEIDTAKDTLAVTGDADPYEIIVHARKVNKCVEVVTIGPPPKKPEEPKKPPPCIPCNCTHMPHSCYACGPLAVVHTTHDPYTTCSIM
ncbi:hypothetical protein R6Q59_001437 [Mikania micrantha]